MMLVFDVTTDDVLVDFELRIYQFLSIYHILTHAVTSLTAIVNL